MHNCKHLLLQLENVHSYYGNIHALQGISLHVNEGEIVTLIGANGAGKSTTIRTISGIMHPREGTILFDGQAIHGVSAHELVGRGIAQSPEGRRVFPRLTVRENLEMGAYRRHDIAYITEDMRMVYDLFPRLEERQHQYGGTLSGGEQQMLAIGRALVTNPRLLILDEATEGLAPLVRHEIWTVLAALKGEGEAILIVDKNVAALGRLADRHAIVEKGRIVWTGTSAALADDPSIRARYLAV